MLDAKIYIKYNFPFAKWQTKKYLLIVSTMDWLSVGILLFNYFCLFITAIII